MVVTDWVVAACVWLCGCEWGEGVGGSLCAKVVLGQSGTSNEKMGDVSVRPSGLAGSVCGFNMCAMATHGIHGVCFCAHHRIVRPIISVVGRSRGFRVRSLCCTVAPLLRCGIQEAQVMFLLCCNPPCVTYGAITTLNCNLYQSCEGCKAHARRVLARAADKGVCSEHLEWVAAPGL